MAEDVLVVGNSLRTMFRFRKHIFDKLCNDYNITIFAPCDTDFSSNEDYQIINSNLSTKRSVSVFQLIDYIIKFRFELKKKYKYVLIYGVSMAFITSILMYFIKRNDFKTIFFFTGLGAIFLRPRYKILKFILLKLIIPNIPDKIIVLNENDKRYLNDIIQLKNREIILMKGEGVPDSLVLCREQGPQRVKRLVFVSRPVYDKGCMEFERLVTALRESSINLPISIYGFSRENPGELDGKYFTKLEDLNCSFEGIVPALETKLSRQDLVLIISDREGANRVLLECLHLRLCFLASPVAGIKNFIPKTLRGKSLVKFTDTTEAVEKIKWFVEQDAVVLERYISEFSNNRLYYSNEELEKLYREKVLS